MEKLYNNYKSIWHCFNPSKSTEKIRIEVIKHLNMFPSKKYDVDKHGNIFVGDFSKNRPCLVAHLDSVHQKKSNNITLNDGILTSNNGIGGDDKCGIIAILEILKTNRNVNAIFPIDEEIGGVGASLIDKDILQNVKYFIEIDRAGNRDIIFESGCNKIASVDFIKDLLPISSKYGFKKDYGTFTDVNILTETSLKSAINVSAGYYNAHTTSEYVILNDLQYTIDFVKEILNTLNKTYEWEGYTDYMQYDDNMVDFSDLDNIEDIINEAYYMQFDDDMIELLIKAYELGYKEKNINNYYLGTIDK